MTLGTLYTFGYQGIKDSAALRRFLPREVDVVIDVRLSPWSGNRAFSLATRKTVNEAGLAYVHEKALGNLGYKRGTIEIADIERIETLLTGLRAGQVQALMCVCPKPAECHRTALVEAILDREPGLNVIHLTRDPLRSAPHVRLADIAEEQSLGLL